MLTANGVKYFLGAGIDSVMNYPMRSALIDAALCRINAEELDDRLMSLKEKVSGAGVLFTAYIISGAMMWSVFLTVMCGAPSKNDVDREYQASYRPDDYIAGNGKKTRAACHGAANDTARCSDCVFTAMRQDCRDTAIPFAVCRFRGIISTG